MPSHPSYIPNITPRHAVLHSAIPYPDPEPQTIKAPDRLSDIAQQLRLEYELALLVLLRLLVGFIVLPSHRLPTLPTSDVPHHVAAGRHVSLGGVARRDVDDVVEEVCLAMLAAKILAERDDHQHVKSFFAVKPRGLEVADISCALL